MNTVVTKKDDDGDSVMKLQEFKVRIVSPFKDGSSYTFLENNIFQWKMKVTVMRYVVNNKHKTGTVIGIQSK